MTFEEWLEACPKGSVVDVEYGRIGDDLKQAMSVYVEIDQRADTTMIPAEATANFEPGDMVTVGPDGLARPVEFKVPEPVPPPAWEISTGPWATAESHYDTLSSRFKAQHPIDMLDEIAGMGKAPRCECGTDACGGGQHDHYCPKYSADRY